MVLVTLTLADPSGILDRISAEAPTYEEALAAAQEKIPDGWQSIVIRTDRDA